MNTPSTLPNEEAAAPEITAAGRAAAPLLLALTPLAAGYLIGWANFGGARGVLVTICLLAAFLFGMLAWINVAVQAPWRKLADLIETLAQSDRPERLELLPVDEPGDLGRVARAVHGLCVRRIRDYQDANRLRRTLDHEVGHATRKATAGLQRLALRDPLTELGNRRAMDEALPGLLAAADDAGNDVLCLLFDMDNFKRVNDTLGHAVGDELIQLLAGLIRSLTRDGDLAVRLGGDEFVLFLPGADTQRAVGLAEQLRRLFRQQSRSMVNLEPRPDLSAGLASLRLDRAADGAALLEVADARLYDAKRLGKGITRGPGDRAAA